MLAGATTGQGPSLDTTAPRIQTETCGDVAYIRSELMAAVRAALSRRDSEVDAIAAARARILAAKKPDDGAAHSKLLARADPDGVREEAEKRLLKWVDSMFDLAGPNIEVNGIEYTKAVSNVQEYEAFDEDLRRRADELQNKVQTALVEVTRLRQHVPGEVDAMVSESMRLLADITTRAQIVENDGCDEGRKDMPSDLAMSEDTLTRVIPDYVDVIRMHAQTTERVGPMLSKARRAQKVLDSLNVPGADEIAAGGVSVRKVQPHTPRAVRRRRSSMAVSAAAAAAAAGSGGPAGRMAVATPRTARQLFVRRLEREAQRGHK